jgi:hypothetical protein
LAAISEHPWAQKRNGANDNKSKISLTFIILQKSES